jgi:uncharacterized membrane protein YfcA
MIEFNDSRSFPIKLPSLLFSLPAGGAIGLLSGLVGVGGGIFLSPLLLLLRWADPKHTAATSAAFIFINSLAGLAGKMVSHLFQLSPLIAYMILSAFLGGIIGSRLGANHFSARWLNRVLACILLIAALKLLRVLPL